MNESVLNNIDKNDNEVTAHPFFSVVVPVHNKGEVVKESIFSILEQTFSKFEIIIVDDGSTDSSRSVIDSITDSRIKIIEQKNSGQGAARNAGINVSRAPFIAFLDADDTWSKGHLECLFNLINLFPEASAFCSAFSYVKHGREFPLTFKTLPSSPWEGFLENYIKTLVEETSPITTNSICVRREALIALDGFKKNLPLAQDVDLWIRLFVYYKIAYSSKVTNFYHLGTSLQVTRKANRHGRYWPFVVELDKYIKDSEIALVHRHQIENLQRNFAKQLVRMGALAGDSEFVEKVVLSSFFSSSSSFFKFFIIVAKMCSVSCVQDVLVFYKAFRQSLVKFFSTFRLMHR